MKRCTCDDTYNSKPCPIHGGDPDGVDTSKVPEIARAIRSAFPEDLILRDFSLEEEYILIDAFELTDSGNQVYRLLSLDPDNHCILKVVSYEDGKLGLVSALCQNCYYLVSGGCLCGPSREWQEICS